MPYVVKLLNPDPVVAIAKEFETEAEASEAMMRLYAKAPWHHVYRVSEVKNAPKR